MAAPDNCDKVEVPARRQYNIPFRHAVLLDAVLRLVAENPDRPASRLVEAGVLTRYGLREQGNRDMSRQATAVPD